MSRIGKLPITVPSGVDVAIDGRTVTVKGPKGTLTHTVVEPITVERADDGTVQLNRPDDERRSKAMHGLSRSLVQNIVVGVTPREQKKQEIGGGGVPRGDKRDNLEFALGFSHPVVVEPPAGVTFTVETPTRFSVSGIDKQLVGETAANIRKIRKPEPYKGKGVRYSGENVRRKVGKTGK